MTEVQDVVVVYELEYRTEMRGPFKPASVLAAKSSAAAKPQWCARDGGAVDAPEVLAPPAGRAWAASCGWRVDESADSGEHDADGWEYATHPKRFQDTKRQRRGKPK